MKLSHRLRASLINSHASVFTADPCLQTGPYQAISGASDPLCGPLTDRNMKILRLHSECEAEGGILLHLQNIQEPAFSVWSRPPAPSGSRGGLRIMAVTGENNV